MAPGASALHLFLAVLRPYSTRARGYGPWIGGSSLAQPTPCWALEARRTSTPCREDRSGIWQWKPLNFGCKSRCQYEQSSAAPSLRGPSGYQCVEARAAPRDDAGDQWPIGKQDVRRRFTVVVHFD